MQPDAEQERVAAWRHEAKQLGLVVLAGIVGMAAFFGGAVGMILVLRWAS